MKLVIDRVVRVIQRLEWREGQAVLLWEKRTPHRPYQVPGPYLLVSIRIQWGKLNRYVVGTGEVKISRGNWKNRGVTHYPSEEVSMFSCRNGIISRLLVEKSVGSSCLRKFTFKHLMMYIWSVRWDVSKRAGGRMKEKGQLLTARTYWHLYVCP